MKTKTVTVFRAHVMENARIDRTKLISRMEAEGLDVSCVPRPRHDNDALRIGVSSLFKQHCRFKTKEGIPCRLLVSEAKMSEADVRLDIHARADGKEVKYSENLVSLTLVNGGVKLEASPNAWAILSKVGITELVPQDILREGRDTLFSRDLRRVIDGVIPSMDLKAWRGVYFAFGEDALVKVRQTQKLLENLDEGAVSISALTLENTPQNLQQIAADLQSSFSDRFASLLDRLKTDPGVSLKSVRKEYDQLLASHSEMETQLDEAIDIYDAAEECEAWLLLAELEAASNG